MIYIIYFIFLISSCKTSDYSLIIDEKISINKTIYKFPYSYELINNFQSNFFTLINNNQDLILTKIIDRDYWCLHNICSCDYCSFIIELFTNYNNIPKFSTINITINDINDHTLQFIDIQTNIYLSEFIKINHSFSITRAIDYDSGINSQLSFKLLNNNDYIQLNIIKLSLNEYSIYGIVKKLFDRELNDKYDLIIEGHDHGSFQMKYNRTNITIWILDENDNAPIFNQTEYSIQSLPEDTQVGTELIKITAYDSDKGLNGLIHYSIINSSSISMLPFIINSTTGILSLHLPLDYEINHSYRFLIRASDSGLPQSLYTDTWLTIIIKNINDCPVEIIFIPNRYFQYNNQTLFIYENTQINNLTLGYIRLFDHDLMKTNLSITFIILNNNNNSKQEYELIETNQLNSYIFLVKQGIFDREIQSNINIRFIATDYFLTTIYDLNINLIDINDNPSIFLTNPIKFFIEELGNYHMIEYPIEDYQLTIGYLNAIDYDQGENALNKYELELNSLVKIDSNTGRLYLIQPLDREQIQNIQLKAKAINIAEPKWITDVQIDIQVLDVNDNIPQCSKSYYHILIPENYLINKPLIKIPGIDPDNDINGTINYTFETNSTWLFYINQTNGEIYSKNSFDYESEYKNFSLIINLEDNGKPIKNQHKNSCQIDIYLEDINDNSPELLYKNETKFFFDIQKILKNSFIFLNIIDKDSGINGKIKYTLKSIESNLKKDFNQTLFKLNQNGTLQILYNIKQICLFKLIILLEDYGYPLQQTLIEINIAFGDSFNSKYSTFNQIEKLFLKEKSLYNNYFPFIYGLSILIILFIFIICILIFIRLYKRNNKPKHSLCLSSQQLNSNIQLSYWNEKSFIDQYSSSNSSTSESYTYKILHIPNDTYLNKNEKIIQDNYQTNSSDISIHGDHLFNQLPYFITKCKTFNQEYMIEMNVDESDEDTR